MRSKQSIKGDKDKASHYPEACLVSCAMNTYTSTDLRLKNYCGSIWIVFLPILHDDVANTTNHLRS